MSLTLVATPGAANANSYATLAEAESYYEGRSPVAAWEDADSQEALLVMATRVIDVYFSGQRVRVDAKPPYFRIGPRWTGAPVDSVQALAWPRTGMLSRNGFALASDAIPKELKDATAELAIQLALADRTLDNKAAVQGIASASAGPVSVSFRDGALITKLLPDIVAFMIPYTWYSEEYIEGISSFDFEVIQS